MMKKNKNFKLRRKSDKKVLGFTLIELLASIVIFGIVMSLVLGSLWTMVKTREQAVRFRNLQQELHFGMVKIADLVRAHGIDYAAHEKNGIELSSDFGNETLFLGHDLFGSPDHPLKLEIIGSEDTPGNILVSGVPLFSEQVQLKTDEDSRFRDVKFRVIPEKDPFRNYARHEFQLQPRIEIYLVLQDRLFPDLEIPIQTTISSRKYSP